MSYFTNCLQKQIRLSVITAFLSLTTLLSYSQTDTEFWFAAPEVTNSHGDRPIAFRLTTLNEPAQVTISQPANNGFAPIVINMPANSFQTVDLTGRIDMVETRPFGVVRNTGLLIESSAPINAYYEVQRQNNPDIFSLKGTFAKGVDFVIPGQRSFVNGGYAIPARNHFVIVATEDNTQVTIDAPNGIENWNNNIVNITLNRGQSFSATATGGGIGQKIGGSIVTSNRPIAITIADDSVADAGCRDLMGDQIVPTVNVGDRYVVPTGPIGTSGGNDFIYVWPTENNTEIFINGNPTPIATRNKGQFLRVTASATPNTTIETSNPAYVLHISGFGCERGWALVPPIECTGSRTVTFNRTTDEAFHLMIIVSQGFQGDFLLNGNAGIINAANFTVAPGTNGDYLTALIQIPGAPVNQPITVTNTNSVFHLAVINGGANTGCRYGYFSAFGKLNLGEDQLVCKGEEITFTASFAYDTYLWNNDPNETGVFFTTSDTGWVFVQVTLGACVLTDSVYVQNFPQPEFLLAQDTAFCANTDLLLTINAGGNFTDYLWSNGSTDPAITITQAGNYWVSVTDEFGCNLSDTTTVTALSIPSFELFAPLPPSICAKDTVEINLTGDFSFTWLTDSTLNTYTGANVFAFPELTKLYKVQGMDINGCVDTLSFTVNVNPLPSATFSQGDATICPHDFFELTLGLNSGIEPLSFQLTNPTGTEIYENQSLGNTIFNIVDPGVYQLNSVTDFNNCTRFYNLEFELSNFILPTVEVAVSDTIVCVNQELTLNASGANTYAWVFGNGLNQNNLAQVTANPTVSGYYTVIGTDNNQCRDTTSVSINVVLPPSPDFNFNNNGCDALIANFENLTTGEWRFFNWNLGNGTSTADTTNFSANYSTVGTFPVTLTAFVNNTCFESVTKNLVVHPSPTASFIFETVCQLEETQFLNASSNNNGPIINAIQWNFGDGNGSTINNPFHTYANHGDFEVNLIVATEFCSDSISQIVSVRPKPTAEISPEVLEGCTPLSVAVNSTSQGATNWNWNFGNGENSSLENNNILFQNPGSTNQTFAIQLFINSEFGCSDSSSVNITVFPKPVADFAINTNEGCTPLTVDFTQNSTLINTVNWNFGGTTLNTLGNFNYVFENATTDILNFPLELIVTTQYGCQDTTTNLVQVFPAVNADFTTDLLEGCSPLAVVLTNTTSGGQGTGFNFNWTLGNSQTGGATEENPSLLFVNNDANPRIENLILVASNSFGCNDTKNLEITVFPKPVADFAININEGCTPLAVDFTQNSTLINTVNWNFGGTTLNTLGNFNYVFENATTDILNFPLELIVTTQFGCLDTTTNLVRVFPAVNADFTADVLEGCSPLAVVLNNNTSGGQGTGFNFNWTLGNSQTGVATEENPSLLFVNNDANPRIENLILVASNSFGCNDTKNLEITVFPKPVADFAINTNEGCTPLTVDFTQNSTLLQNALWNLNGTIVNNVGNFTQTFVNTSTELLQIPLELIVTTQFGCKDTTTNQVQVFPAVIANFAADIDMACTPFEVQLQNNTTGGSGTGFTYNWNFNEATGDFASTNPLISMINPGVSNKIFDITLTASNSFGCEDTFTKIFTAFPSPQAEFEASVLQGCQPLDVVFTNTSQQVNDTYFHWNFGDAEWVHIPNEQVNQTFFNFNLIPDNRLVQLTAFTDFGCESTYEVELQVFPIVEAGFQSPDEICAPGTLFTENTSIGANNFMWQIAGVSTLTQPQPSIDFPAISGTNSNTQVTLIAMSQFGCSDTTSRNISIYSIPNPEFTLNPETITWPDNFTVITNQSPQVASWNYNWNLGNGNTFTGFQPGMVTYNNWGDYPVTLTINNNICQNTLTKNLTINPPLPRSFFDGNFLGCEPLQVQFENTSQWAETSTWNFGDGNIITVAGNTAPLHTYQEAGVYSVTLTVSGPGGESTRTRQNVVVVRPRPFANFDAYPLEVIVPEQTVQFTNLSEGALSYFWNFGDGNTSTAVNPNHRFLRNGIMDITLIAENRWGCKDTLVQHSLVRAIGNSRLDIPNVFAPNTAGGNGGYFEQGRPNNTVFFPVMSGAIAYSLEIFNRWGERIFSTRELNRGWDGYHNGKLAQQGAYVYKIKVQFSDGSSVDKIGDVTLLW
ncbi:MAG: PKD domain-containing protein [Luteibaculaceae bacterium]